MKEDEVPIMKNHNSYHQMYNRVFDRRLKTIDGETLMNTELRPLSFVVDTLLAQGLHILAGSPKAGKSWLALWLAVSVAKGEDVWGLPTKQGTTLYLCLEDSSMCIQNRLEEITDQAPPSIHFSTESRLLGDGLEEQLESFLAEHPDTVLVIIDTLQMIRGAHRDSSYGSDYHELTKMKRIADTHEIALLLVHHLRKEPSGDVLSRIPGTTAISGAVDSSLTLIEKYRGSGEATLYCIGRDIPYRELDLRRNEENVWELVNDSLAQPKGGKLICLLSAFMGTRQEFIGTPTELVGLIDPDGMEQISPRTISREVTNSLAALRKNGIAASIRRSNGRRLITLHRAESAGNSGAGNSDLFGTTLGISAASTN